MTNPATPKKAARRSSIVTNTEQERPKAVRAILEGRSDEEVEAVRPRGPWTTERSSAMAVHLSAVLGCLPSGEGQKVEIRIAGNDGLPVILHLPAGGLAMCSPGGVIEVYRPTDVESVKIDGIPTRRVRVLNQDEKLRDHGTAKPMEGGVFQLDKCLPDVLWSPRLLEIIQGVGEPPLPIPDAD